MSQQMVVEHPMIIPTDGGYKSYGNTNFSSIPQKTSPKPQKPRLGLPKAKRAMESQLQNQGLDLRLRAAWCGLGHDRKKKQTPLKFEFTRPGNTKNDGTSPFLMGKSTISMGHFPVRKLLNYQRVFTLYPQDIIW